MTVACIDCVHLDGKGTPREIRRAGFMRCKKKSPHTFFSPAYPRECQTFRQAPEDEVQARRAWLNRDSSDAQSGSSTATPATPCSTSNTSTRSP